MKRAAIYARFSTELQNPRSCEDQIALCQRYAAEHGIAVVTTYQDAAVSGATAARGGYQALLAATQQRPKPFDTIICKAHRSCLARHRRAGDYASPAPAPGDRADRRGSGTPLPRSGAETQFAVHGLVSALYVANVRDKTHRGLDSLARKGLSTGGKTYGYRSAPIAGNATAKQLVIDEAEAAIVRRIFEEYRDGKSLRTIVHSLNDERVPSPSKGAGKEAGRPGWGITTVRWVLRNERYLGRVVWNRLQFVKDPDTGKRRPVKRPNPNGLPLRSPSYRSSPTSFGARWRAAGA